MSIDLETLRNSLSKIGEIASGELTFKANEHDVTLRAMASMEEQEVEKWGQGAWEDALSDEDSSALGQYLDRMRIGSLSHAIIQIGELNLRDEDFIETGEKDAEGNLIRRPRYKVVRDIISKWPRQLLHLCFLKYGELMQSIEMKATKAIEFEPKDIDAELDRLHARIGDLEEIKKKKQEQLEADIGGVKATKAVVEAGQAIAEHRRTVAEEAVNQQAQVQRPAPAAPQAPPQTQSYPPMRPPATDVEVEQATQPRQPGAAIPRQATPQPPPVQRAPEPPAPEPVQSAPEPQPEPETDAMGVPAPYGGDSFFEPGEPEAAMEAENRRLAQFRQQQHQRRGEELAQHAPQPPRGLRDAVKANHLVEKPAIVKGTPKGASQEIQGYKLPTQTLEHRGDTPNPRQKVTVDSAPKTSRNPRFRGGPNQ